MTFITGSCDGRHASGVTPQKVKTGPRASAAARRQYIAIKGGWLDPLGVRLAPGVAYKSARASDRNATRRRRGLAYSYLSATIGSTRIARRAGIAQATSATTVSTMETVT